MSSTVKRVVAALTALLGLALAIAGLWIVTRVGSSGTASFSGKPSGAGAVVLTPAVLNRLDADVVVRATAPSGAKVWIGATTPSDAKAVVGSTEVTTATGADTSAWKLRLEHSGSGPTPALAQADIWRERAEGSGSATLTIDQTQAPDALVIVSDKGTITDVTVSMQRKAWFVQALIAVVVGLALLAGALLLWRSARHRVATSQTEERA